ncbi:WD repeat-containing protein 48-like [Halichondria panicea]|uniref:WD repeat-containing protein 48-like n=1 Tax=Halichondria panicea TaxID=6063 RepID=UPI00312B6717
MSSRGYGSGGGGTIRSVIRRKVAISYVIRDVEEKLNRSGVNKLCFDRTHQHLYTAGRDSIIRSWDLSQYSGNNEIPHLKSFEHHTDWVNDIALCIDGKYMMSASSDTTIKLWDTNKGSCASTLRTHKDYVKCLAYAKDTELVASAGLDKNIYLWDIKTLTSLTSANNTITTTTVTGSKESVYSLVLNDAGTVLICGSTEKLLRVWDPRTCERSMKLKGHTDNVRALLLNRDGTMCLSGSSDGTVRLWSLGQQRCVETFRIHEEGVWALAVDNEFTTFYSGGRDKKVYATELFETSQESTLLFCEESPILSLALDTSGGTDSLWVATTDTSINKWSVDPKLLIEEGDGLVSGEESEEEVVITNIDEPTPFITKPVATLPGGSSIKDFRVLNNRQQVLTRDSNDNVALWDVMHARKIKDLGPVNMDDEAAQRQEKYYTPNWFSVEVKTGMLTIRLEENECFSAWVIGSRTNAKDVASDLKMNLGALLLHALFEHWPSTHPQQEEKHTDKAPLAPSPPPPPQLEELLEICAGCDAVMWEKLAAALTIPEEEVERLKNTHPSKPELCLEDLFKMWLKEAEDVTWDRFSESLATIEQTELAERVEERLVQYHEQQKTVGKETVESSDVQDYLYFDVPKHTPVIIAESGDCGTTLVRFLAGDAGGNHETKQLNNSCPVWAMDIVCQKKLPGVIKINFTLVKEPKNIKGGKDDRLSAQDLLSIRKVQEYVCPRLFGNKEGKVDNLEEQAGQVEVQCMDQVLDPELDLRTVKYFIWKSSGDVKLVYREKVDPSVLEEAPLNGEKTEQLASND